MVQKKQLLGMTIDELSKVVSEVKLPAYAAKQMADWLYKKKIVSIEQMTNIPLAKRQLLEETYEIGTHESVNNKKSTDGTIKYLFQVAADQFIETVQIPDGERTTLCVSSQIGCKMNCLFCMTGKQGFNGNLSASQILNQIQSIPDNDQLTNIVFMGMGEPLDNIDELFKVLDILTSSYGYGWSPKRITVSTVGVLKGLKRFLDESSCNLAVSLHSPNPDQRQSLIPVEKKYPIRDVIELLKQYDFAHQRRLSFEYTLFENLNDSVQHAKDLAKLLKGVDCRVNLIKYHEIPHNSLKSSSSRKLEIFRDTLNALGIICTIRTSRGEDISAACGMLSTSQMNETC